MKKKILFILLIMVLVMPMISLAGPGVNNLDKYNDMLLETVIQYSYKDSFTGYQGNSLFANVSSTQNWEKVHTTPEMLSSNNIIKMNEVAFLQYVYYEAFKYVLMPDYSNLTIAGLVEEYENGDYSEDVVPIKDTDGIDQSNLSWLRLNSQVGDIIVLYGANSDTSRAILLLKPDSESALQYVEFVSNENNKNVTFGTLSDFIESNSNNLQDYTDLVVIRPHQDGFSDLSISQFSTQFPKTQYRLDNKLGITVYCDIPNYKTLELGDSFDCIVNVKNMGATSVTVNPSFSVSNNATVTGNSGAKEIAALQSDEFQYSVTVKDNEDYYGSFVQVSGGIGEIDFPTFKYKVAHRVTSEEASAVQAALDSNISYSNMNQLISELYGTTLSVLNYNQFNAENFINSVFDRNNNTYTLTNTGNDLSVYAVPHLCGGTDVYSTEDEWLDRANSVTVDDLEIGDIVTFQMIANLPATMYVYGGEDIGLVNVSSTGDMTTQSSNLIMRLPIMKVFTVHRPLMRITENGGNDDPGTERPDDPGNTGGDKPGYGVGDIITNVPDTLKGVSIIGLIIGFVSIGYGSYIIITNRKKEE